MHDTKSRDRRYSHQRLPARRQPATKTRGSVLEERRSIGITILRYRSRGLGHSGMPVLRTPSRIPRFLPDRSRHSVWSVISKVELQYRLLVTSISAVPYMTLRRRANKKLSAS